MMLADLLDQIPELFTKWGPAAIATVLMLVAENKLRNRWKETTEGGKDHIALRRLYIGNWIFIALMLSIVTYLYVENITDSEKIRIKGVISKVPQKTEITSKYLYQNPVLESIGGLRNPREIRKNIHWRVIQTPNQDITFTVIGEDEATCKNYMLPPDERNIRLRYKQISKNDFKITYHKSDKPLKSEPCSDYQFEEDATYSFSSFLIKSAYAENVTFEDIESSLEDRSYAIRRNATKYLAKNISSYVKNIDKALKKENISDKKLLGLLSALTMFKADSQQKKKISKKFSKKTKNVILDAMFHDSPTIQQRATRVALRYLRAELSEYYDKRCGNSNSERCANLGMYIFYDMATHPIFVEHIKKVSQIKQSIDLLESKKELWKHVARDQQIQHAKILYGIGLLHEELAQTYEKKKRHTDAKKTRTVAAKSFT